MKVVLLKKKLDCNMSGLETNRASPSHRSIFLPHTSEYLLNRVSLFLFCFDARSSS